ncbi:unnamed protein product [Gongylonema pulchrum]|uniref:Neur_chan_memb domain-containing protein n=1 Tax=Gongylonema pulchrum TaxID=637853 RepID=A0A183D6N1_9BILA|nr:unnamed protein product [Gongylonema pulchrum]
MLPYMVLVILFSIDALVFLSLPETKSRELADQMPPKEELILNSCKSTRTMSIPIDDDDTNINSTGKKP